MLDYKYVIIGGGLAAGRACDGIRKVDVEGTVALVTDEPHPPYQRPPLSKGYLVGKDGLDKVYLAGRKHYAENGIDVLTGVRATKVDADEHRVILGDGRVLAYGKLLLATGGQAKRLRIPGGNLARVFTLRRIEDAQAIRDAAKSGKRAMVLGGSFIGSEVAASLTRLGIEVTMVFPESRLLARVVPGELSALLHKKYEGHGIQIMPGIKPISLGGDEMVEWVELDNGQTVPVDLVVMGVGIALNTTLAQDAELDVDNEGAVMVNSSLQTSNPHIYAAGDIAAWPSFTFGKRLHVEHWDVARGQGLRAGRNMAGEDKEYTAIPYFFSDLFDFGFEVWGDLTIWNQTVLRGTLESGSFAVFYFSQAKIVGVLAVDRPDEERKPMQALIRARVLYEGLAARLQEEAVDLGEVIG